MNEDQIQELYAASHEGPIYWQDTGGFFHRLLRVVPEPTDVEGDGFLIPVAYLERGGYIDLENVIPESLHSLTPIFGDES